ncbi:pyridoxamine 5'-phosphate oxidase family protein [Streptomyces anulatus]|uniref:pyridoxamine 5'-phosphate oxidase family protein n=1 Tax=Streptomyces anulatus TaxID=1892 RepID=UPI0036A25067
MSILDAATPFGEEVGKRLAEEHVIWLTTIGADTTPQPNPVWFHWENDGRVAMPPARFPADRPTARPTDQAPRSTLRVPNHPRTMDGGRPVRGAAARRPGGHRRRVAPAAGPAVGRQAGP